MLTTEGLISRPCPYSVRETLDRLEALLLSKNVTIFAAWTTLGRRKRPVSPCHQHSFLSSEILKAELQL